VRVFTIAHGVDLVEGQLQTLGEGGRLVVGVERGEPVGDGPVVARGMHEGFLGQREARGGGDCAAVGLHLGNDDGVVGRFDDNRAAALFVAVVLRRGAHHGRAADVDVFDGVRQRAVLLCDGLLEGVEVDDDQVDGRYAVLFHRRRVPGVAADAEDAAMHLRMQGLDAAVEHLGETGVVGHVGDGEAGIAQQLGRAAGGEQLDAEGGEFAREIDRAVLVGNADERLGDLHVGLLKRCCVRQVFCGACCG